MRVISTGYEARPQFAPFHARTQRFAVIVAHRRAGKTVSCANDLIDGALRCTKPNPRFAYLAPYFKQAKDVAWQYVRDYTRPIPGVGYNEAELRVDLPNGGRVRLYGADNPDSLRGIYLDGVVLDEYADMDPRVWSEVLRPALADRGGWAVFIGTPKGHNGFYDIWKDAQDDPEWFALLLKASETGIVAEAELTAARKAMSEDQYAQEFECSFEAAIQGSYYGALMRHAEDEGRICAVPYDTAVRVDTWWDLGIGDATSIIFAQRVGREIHIIDYYEASGEGLAHYAKVLDSKPYLYGTHCLPHDVQAKELGTGKTREETLKTLGLTPTVIPMHRVEDGIEAARNMIPMCWFDRVKCERLVEALKQYRKEFDESRKVFKLKPLHDWTSHPADAFRYGAMHKPSTGFRQDIRPYPQLGII